MIQRAHFVTDKEEIIRLWQQCFGDSRDYVEFFLENCPAGNVLFLYREESEVTGMMFLMQGKLMLSDNASVSKAQSDLSKKVYYLYALCVDEKYRGRGIANDLLDFAKDYAEKDNAEICLVPSSSKLRKYYAQRGFVDVFVRTEQEINVDGSKMFGGKIRKTDINIADLIKARTEAYGSNAFLLNEDNLGFAIEENAYSGGFAMSVEPEDVDEDAESADGFVFAKGTPYIIGDVDGGILQVRETNLKLSVVYRIACEYNCDKVKFFNIKEPFEEYRLHTMPYAMMADTVQVEEFVKKIRFDKRYINFCFD